MRRGALRRSARTVARPSASRVMTSGATGGDGSIAELSAFAVPLPRAMVVPRLWPARAACGAPTIRAETSHTIGRSADDARLALDLTVRSDPKYAHSSTQGHT